MSRIRAITFDAGGTLIEPWPSVGAVYAEVAAEFGFDCPPARLNEQFAGAWKSRADFGYTREEWFDVVRQSFIGTCDVSPELFDAIYQRFTRRHAWLIYDDVIPALQQLEAAGFTLAVISNWDERLIALLETLGLATYFSQIIVSSDIDAHKPDPHIFTHAARELGLRPAEILHVGDSEREDIQGARAVGFHAKRIRRSGATEPHDIQTLVHLPTKVPHL
jgi:putative hydrolase of the HAD superfamily